MWLDHATHLSSMQTAVQNELHCVVKHLVSLFMQEDRSSCNISEALSIGNPHEHDIDTFAFEVDPHGMVLHATEPAQAQNPADYYIAPLYTAAGKAGHKTSSKGKQTALQARDEMSLCSSQTYTSLPVGTPDSRDCCPVNQCGSLLCLRNTSSKIGPDLRHTGCVFAL